MCMCSKKWCTASAQPDTKPSARTQASSTTRQCPRRWQQLWGRERERRSPSSSWKRAVAELLWVRSKASSHCTAAGPRGVMDKQLGQGWGLGYFALSSSSTFNWVQMFSHCSFTERLWITLKSQEQKTLMAKSPVELLTLSRKERDTLQGGEGHQRLGLGEGEGWQCHGCC